MSHLLAADIGKRRTGLALADTKAGFVMALETVTHTDEKELVEVLRMIVQKHAIVEIIVGLPLLPQGKIGEQALYIEHVARLLKEKINIPITFFDERYTTPQSTEFDKDASAACSILTTVLDQRA